MKKILWISPYVPYDKVDHAGGQIENFYVKGLKKHGFDIRVLSFCTVDEIEKIDLEKYNISNDIITLKRDRISKITRAVRYNTLESKYNPFNKYGNLVSNNFIICVMQKVKEYKKLGYSPEIIVLDWTESGLLTEQIKKIFPDVKIVCIEEDVAYLGYQRRVQYVGKGIRHTIWNLKYKNLKKAELAALNSADAIVCLNNKDKKLLVSDCVDENKIITWAPYFFHYDKVERKVSEKCKLLFFGNMAREENYASVIWFIENVLPLISDLNVEFNVVGAKPAEILNKYESDNVHIVGFVNDVSEYFATSQCMVAPLVLGAGIKIKVLEALSAGIPVLTNDIGIEGILATHGIEYVLCKKPEDYAEAIRYIYKNPEYGKMISNNAKSFIEKNYNMTRSLKEFICLINQL